MLINIDYLIINLSGANIIENKGSFHLEKHERGTKIFQNVFDIHYENIKIGTLLSNPYENSVLQSDFKQLQFENNLFYTIQKNKLKEIIYSLLNTYQCSFDSINRLDICIDHKETDLHKNLMLDLLTKKFVLAGREKNISTYYVSKNGKIEQTGIQIGKRSNSRFLRIYNKTLQLENESKEYISDWHNNNNLFGKIWRIEYQLNNKFFKGLKRVENDIQENICWSIFDENYLKELFLLAKKNHFELKENTGKTEINKEREVSVLDYTQISNVSNKETFVSKIKEKFNNKVLGIKRTIKSLFTEYYKSFQELEYIIPLQKLLDKYSLQTWFNEKHKFYIAECKKKELLKEEFNYQQFYSDLEICI